MVFLRFFFFLLVMRFLIWFDELKEINQLKRNMSDTFGFVLNVKGGIEKKMDKSNKRKLYNYCGEMSDQDEKIVMGKTNLFHYYF